ncbi:MAG: threonylcarbamoyl-AMP synthase [Treponema sp.]|jgi:L-threonylcarbamoyladenylate synthase|nr:threonylcarbamoyl-AMP synthase [Treponema sp.]
MMILGVSEQDIRKAAEIIRSGGLVAFPTETVYGLGADVFNTSALARVFEAKGRPRFDPLIIHIAERSGLEHVARLSDLSPDRRALAEKCAAAFWPGPLTLVLPKQREIPGLATAGLATAAVRWPAHPAAQALIRLSGSDGKPGAVAAPSANPFGRLSPTRAEHVIEGLGEKIDCVIDGGPCPVGVESTVLDLSSPRITILRPGGVTKEELEKVVGPIRPSISGEPDTDGPDAAAPGAPGPESGRLSPGMLKSHYAPKTPLFLHSGKEMAALPYKKDETYLFFSGESRRVWAERNRGLVEEDKSFAGENKIRAGGENSGPAAVVLSEKGSLLEAAANLFEYLRRLDGPARIHAEILPEEGLGAAVNDRLRRAAAKRG